MSLAGAGLSDHVVARQGGEFLVASQREDGSWPIDTNLATWVTTLSVNALACGSRLNEYLDADERTRIRDWLLDQQYTEVHPYTGAAPGGWAWTDLPGGVPDADDTCGAILALAALGHRDGGTQGPLWRAADWIERVQNADGGIPTFCRGWGRLPFDRSSCDITAHAKRALEHVRTFDDVFEKPHERAASFLMRSQGSDGTWLPLWFGNQCAPDEVNRLYGTSRVMLTRRDDRAHAWIMSTQNRDGGWGGDAGAPSSIEETALALEGMASGGPQRIAKPQAAGAVKRGVAWLIERTQRGTIFDPAPIGFYFAKLWYYEELYPVIWTVAALERVRGLLDEEV